MYVCAYIYLLLYTQRTLPILTSPLPILYCTHPTRYSPLPGTLLSTTVIKGSSGLTGGGVLVGGVTLRDVARPTPCRTTKTTVDPASFSACTASPWVTPSMLFPLTLKIWSSILHTHTHTLYHTLVRTCMYVLKIFGLNTFIRTYVRMHVRRCS